MFWLHINSGNFGTKFLISHSYDDIKISKICSLHSFHKYLNF